MSFSSRVSAAQALSLHSSSSAYQQFQVQSASHHHGSIMRSDPILMALRVPCGQRKESDLAPIVDFVKGLKFFHSFSTYPETVAQIAARLELQSFVNGSHVFHEGEVGYSFYVILDGEVSIYKRKRVQSADNVLENVLLVRLGCGQHFGEAALENKDGLRTASAVASKTCNLLVLHREDYLTILSQFKVLLKVAVRRSLCMASSMFSHLSRSTIDSLANVAVIRSFTPNSVIYLSGTRISNLMIVKSGLVKLIKPISKVDFEAAIKEVGKKLKHERCHSALILGGSGNRSPLRNRLSSGPGGRSLRSSSASTNKPFSPASSSFSAPTRHRTVYDPKQAAKETPPGHWILTRSEDYVAKSKAQLSLRESIPLSGGMDIAGTPNVRRLSFGASGRSTPNTPAANSVSPLKVAVHNQNVSKLASTEQVDFTVGTLMTGDVLGEVCILDAENISPITAIASTSVELYCIDVEVLIELGIPRDEKIMRCLLDDWKFRNPPTSEIRKKFKVKYEWEIKKQEILTDLKR
jgi:CRP-like cAMP-binding protein